MDAQRTALTIQRDLERKLEAERAAEGQARRKHRSRQMLLEAGIDPDATPEEE